MQDYYKARDLDNYKKLKEALLLLPDFCSEFFMGINNSTSSLTRINYANDLNIFFEFLSLEVEFHGKSIKDFKLKDLELVTASQLEVYLNYLSTYERNDKLITNGEKGKARKLATVRSMYKYFYNKDKIKENVPSKVQLPKLHDKEIIRLEADEIKTLIENVESGRNLSKKQLEYFDKTRLRDLAILSLFLSTGIRISECVGLNIKDFDFKNNSFVVTRKGGNRTILYYPDDVKYTILGYLETRAAISDTKNDDPLFISLQNNRISVRAIQMLVKKYCFISSPLKKMSPHKLRSTFGTQLYKQTKDIYIVADVLGHKDVNTTKKHYAAISDDIRRAAAKNINIRNDDNE